MQTKTERTTAKQSSNILYLLELLLISMIYDILKFSKRKKVNQAKEIFGKTFLELGLQKIQIKNKMMKNIRTRYKKPMVNNLKLNNQNDIIKKTIK